MVKKKVIKTTKVAKSEMLIGEELDGLLEDGKISRDQYEVIDSIRGGENQRVKLKELIGK